MRNLNDKNAQLQKQLDNVIREGPSLLLREGLSRIMGFCQQTENSACSTARKKVEVSMYAVSLSKAHTMNLFSAELERDLEIERRRVRELQEASRDRDKEYAKLKASHSLGHINDVANGIQRLQGQFDKVRKRALFGPPNDQGAITPAQVNDDPRTKLRQAAGNVAANVNISAVVGGMEANGVNVRFHPVQPEINTLNCRFSGHRWYHARKGVLSYQIQRR